MKPRTKAELHDAINETERQEKMFRLAGDDLMSAHWILERVKLRSQLYCLIQKEAFHGDR